MLIGDLTNFVLNVIKGDLKGSRCYEERASIVPVVRRKPNRSQRLRRISRMQSENKVRADGSVG